MPPRRTHKKSRKGCVQCKTRKIKCDEVHPACGNCQKHGVACDFSDPNAGPNSFDSPASSSATPRISFAERKRSPQLHVNGNSKTAQFCPSPTDIVAYHGAHPASTRFLELRLMHNFTIATAQTLAQSYEQEAAWQVEIPAIAYDAPYLMDAILAVSALHLRSNYPHDHGLVRASHSYMASALAEYSSLLKRGLSEENAEALFATSALIAFQASASRRFEVDPADFPGTYSLPLAWFHSFQGVKTVVMANWRWLRNSTRINPIINGQPPLSLDFDPRRKRFFTPLLDGLEVELQGYPDSLREEVKRAYEHAVAFLNWAHQKPDRSRILGFAATVSRRFVDLIAQQDPRALVIIACFFAMTKAIDDVWWLEGVAKKEVTGIFGLLPPEWLGKMDWPMRISSSDLPMDDNAWGVSYAYDDPQKPDEEHSGDLRTHIDILAQIMYESIPPMPPD